MPGRAFADSAPAPTAAPVASANPSPSSGPAATPTSTAAATPQASPAASASPRSQALQNKQAQGQLIGDLTAAEAHALMLDKSLSQSELSLVALGQKILEDEQAVSRLDGRVAEVSSQHQQVMARLAADRTQLATVVRRLYKHQNNFLVTLLDAGGFGGVLQTLGYSDVVVERERKLVQTVQADDVALAHTQTTLERSRVQKKKVLADLQLAQATVGQVIANEHQLQAQLQVTIDEALRALDAMQTDTPEAAAQRAKLIRMKTDSVLRQVEQAVWAQQNFQTTAAFIAQDPVLSATGRLLWPIPHATITQGFGPSPYLFEAAYAGFPHFHTGLDLAVPLGTPVFAASDGAVVLARGMIDANGSLVGYGNYVVIQHDTGLKTLYGHLMAIGVKEGDVVKRGQLIGLVGSTGNSTGPHTHFEVRIDNSPVDPMQLLPVTAPLPAGSQATGN